MSAQSQDQEIHTCPHARITPRIEPSPAIQIIYEITPRLSGKCKLSRMRKQAPDWRKLGYNHSDHAKVSPAPAAKMVT